MSIGRVSAGHLGEAVELNFDTSSKTEVRGFFSVGVDQDVLLVIAPNALDTFFDGTQLLGGYLAVGRPDETGWVTIPGAPTTKVSFWLTAVRDAEVAGVSIIWR